MYAASVYLASPRGDVCCKLLPYVTDADDMWLVLGLVLEPPELAAVLIRVGYC